MRWVSIAASLFFVLPQYARASVALEGHIAPQMSGAFLLERAAADERVDFSLVARLDQDLLDKTLAEIYKTPPGANRNYLTPAQFARKFGLAEKRQALKDFARANGLDVDPDDQPNSLVVRVSGQAAAVEKAFGVSFNHYLLPDGRFFRGHSSEPAIPESLSPHLGAVVGLSNVPGLAHPHIRFAPKQGPLRLAASAQVLSPALLGGMTGPGNGLAPADIKTIYGLSMALNGSGQTIAIVEFDGFASSDISGYETQFSISPAPAVAFAGVDGAPANMCGPNLNLACNATTFASDPGMGEVALDIELVLALAPRATQLRIYTSFNLQQNILDVYAKIASDNLAQTVSTSWGVPEDLAPQAFLNSENTIFAQMAAQGQSMYAAAGDNGAYDDQSAFPTLTIDDPGAQPYVSAVGGTTLTGTVAAPAEKVWNTCGTPSTCGTGGTGAGGGGFSGKWPMPTAYQSGVPGTASHQFRNTPDVALDADPLSSPYSIFVGGGWNQIGGTSAAAPLWTAFTALINQNRFAGGGGNLGFPNYFMYALGTGPTYNTVFRDITTGNNGFFNARVGYDNASGWGAPKMDAMITALTGVTVAFAPSPPQNLQYTFVSSNSVSLGWSNVSGSTYTMVLSTSADFSSVISSGPGLVNQNATSYFMLTPATYYFEVKVSTNNDYSYSAAVSTYVAGPVPAPPPANVQFTAVSSNSLTVGWTLVGGSSYEMALSTKANFSTTISSAIGPLNQNTTTYSVPPGVYFFKVKVSTAGDASYSLPITTAAANLAGTGTSALCDNGTTLTVVPVTGPITFTFPPGSCGPGPNTVSITIPTVVPGPSTGHGGSIVPLGPMVDVTLTSPLTQFSAAVGVSMTIPATTTNPNLIKLAWYDPVRGQWWPELASSFSPATGLLTGIIWHNTIHGAVAVAASADLAQATVFPNPINFQTAVRGTVKFMGLSPFTTINIYDLAGERVISIPPGTQSGKTVNDGISGTAEWDGRNALGSPVARGVYIYVARDAAGHQHTGKIGVTR